MIYWTLFNTEIYYLIAAAVFLGLSLTLRQSARRDYLTALALSAVGIGAALAGFNQQGDLFAGAYRVDLFSQVFKILLAVGLFLIIFLCSELNSVPENRHPEFYFLLITCTLAMMMLVSSVHLLTIYISLELSSYSLYILVCLRKEDDKSLVSAIRYFLIGATASALMLLGLALLYSAANTAYLIELIKTVPDIIHRPLIIAGLFLTLSGFFFKLAIFPFHFWAPEAYYGAPNQVAAYIATASKVAAIAVLIRVVSLAGGESRFLIHALVCLSIISMTVGNLCAIVQKDLKKLLAYSSIAHAGYVLIGILSFSRIGYGAAVFYALGLLILKFTCFFVVIKSVPDGSNPTIDHLAGLHRRAPILALALMVGLFGLAGIPPTVGFTAKFMVFAAAIEKGLFTLVVIAMLNVAVSLYYYLLLLKAAYLTEPRENLPELIVPVPVKLLAVAMITLIIVTGFFPTYLIQISRAASFMFG